MNFLKELHRGLIKDNAVFVLLLGMCPTLAVTSSGKNGLGMGLASTAVLIGSNVVISLLKRWIPDKVRIPVFIVIIASFVTIIDLTMSAYTPDLHEELGIFIPLIVVNCVILGRAEAFASKNGLIVSIADGLGIGVGFTLSLAALGGVREILGAGTLTLWEGIELFNIASVFPGFQPFQFMVQAPGAFIGLGLMLCLMNMMGKK